MAAFLNRFEVMYKTYLEFGFEAFVTSYEKLCLNIGQDAYIQNRSNKVLVKVISLANNGNLVVKHSDGKIEEVSSGEVSIRGVYGYV